MSSLCAGVFHYLLRGNRGPPIEIAQPDTDVSEILKHLVMYVMRERELTFHAASYYI